MGERTAIAWCHATFNPWWGCAKVSPGCANCYAETIDRRWGEPHWGSASRRFFGDAHWREPLKWNEAARKAGERRRVFCASMADVFELAPGLDEQRIRLWKLIAATPHIDWLLLTKRPENIFGMMHKALVGAPNVWLGTSVEDQERADERIPELLKVPARVRFLSVEPILEELDVLSYLCGHLDERSAGPHQRVSWLIVGGESGPKARPCDVGWIRSIVKQCRASGVPCFVKQLGARPIEMVPSNPVHVATGLLRDLGFEEDSRAVRELATACAHVQLRDPKGADPAEWPADLRVQEFPATPPLPWERAPPPSAT